MLTTFVRNRVPIFSLTLAAAISGVLWATREQPLLVGVLRFDALSLFWLLVLALGPLRHTNDAAKQRPTTDDRPAVHANRSLRWLWLVALACLAVTVRSAIMMIALYGLIAVFSIPRLAVGSTSRVTLASLLRGIAGLFRRTPVPIAASCLALGYGSLALHGITAYDDPSAGAAMSSFVFWFVLLAAVLPMVFVTAPDTASTSFTFIWLYPLVRLYSLGPWNNGWALAAALFGGTAGLWLAWRTLRQQVPLASVLVALALAAFGLASSAGIAAGCFLVLVSAGYRAARRDVDSWPKLIAPLVAIWMLIGAAVAGGMIALAGVAWVVALLLALGTVLHGRAGKPASVRILEAARIALGIGSPLVLFWLIEPVVSQLQGGLTPYGDVRIWPWVGLAFVNSAQAQVAVLPSLAIALLLGVLVALIYLLARLRDTVPTTAQVEDTNGDFTWLWGILREEVPWLGEGQRSDPR